MKPISIVVAVAENNAIGKNNNLLWHLPEDLKRFKRITEGHCIVMGRKTFDSLPKGALPNRTNIVLTKSAEKIEGCQVAHSLEQAYNLCDPDKENFVVGGESVYHLFLEKTQKLYITKVHATFDASVFFPEIDLNNWELIEEEYHKADEKHLYDYSFLTYQRKIRIYE